ncbi:MAG: response regulator [Planctomycetota bacterium]
MTGTTEPTAPRPARTILVVDDNDVARKLITRLLQKRGYTVRNASDGAEALAMVAADGAAIDALVMDLDMPRMGGLEAAAAIRALKSDFSLRLPIIALTADDGVDLECSTAGMNCALTKPVNADHLVEQIERLCGRDRGA